MEENSDDKIAQMLNLSCDDDDDDDEEERGEFSMLVIVDSPWLSFAASTSPPVNCGASGDDDSCPERWLSGWSNDGAAGGCHRTAVGPCCSTSSHVESSCC